MMEWWDRLKYCWNKISKNGEFRSFGVRPWVGAPMVWLVVDRSNGARFGQSEKWTKKRP